ncbi:MAG: hypothetical protein ACP5SG_05675 [Dissulfurimicrobium sp.]|uniref:hypothetical protein n=1 Tax=Dissulfurimicrobium sp. TaxID=2022436 RepID=UPI003D12ECB8
MSIASTTLQGLINKPAVATTYIPNGEKKATAFADIMKTISTPSAQTSSSSASASSDLYQQPGAAGNINNDPSLFGGYGNTREHILNSNLDDAAKQALLDQLNASNSRKEFDAVLLGGHSNYPMDVDAAIDAAIDAGIKPGSAYNTDDYARFAAAYQKYFPLEDLTPPSGYETPFYSSATQQITNPNVSDYYLQNAGSGPWNDNLMAMYREIIG